MGLPSKKIVTNGSRFLVAKIPAGGSTPVEYDISVEAVASIGATEISISSDVVFDLQHDSILDFGGGKIAIVNLPNLSTINDTIEVGTTATAVPVRPLEVALATTDVTTTYAYRELLGVTDCSTPMQPQTVDGTDMRTGFAQANVVVGVNRSVNVTFFRVEGDRAIHEIIMPYLTDDEEIQESLWAKAILSTGDVFEGIGRFTDGGSTGAVRNLAGGNLTFNFEGSTESGLFLYSNAIQEALLNPTP